MNHHIPLSVPNLDMDILDNIKVTIESGWVSTGGQFIRQFEDDLKQYVQAKGARSIQSGTGGLHLALKVLGVEPGDEVIVPTLTFIATVNPVIYLHASPVFMDCDDSLNMDPIKLKEFLDSECVFQDGKTVNKKTGKHIRGMIVVHVFGNPADMASLMQIAQEYNLFVLEDAAEALGSYYTSGPYQGKHCGTVGDIGVYSFNANKIITTGNGGMVVSENSAYLDEINFLSVQAKSDALRYIHDDIGYNYRLTNISAAFGVSQIKRIESFIVTKHQNYLQYKSGIADISGLSLMEFNSGTRPNYWFYSLLIDEKKYGHDREGLMQILTDHQIQSRPIWGLIHEQKPYRSYQSYKIEKAAFYVNHILNIPCSTNLTSDEVDIVLDVLKRYQLG